MLKYKQYKPSKILLNFIECYWECKAPAMTMAPLERLVPGGRVELIFNFGNPMNFMMTGDSLNGYAITHSHLMGQRSKVYYAKQNGETNLLGVRFKPGGISAFTKIPAVFFLNQVVNAEDVFGIAIKGWKERLLEMKSDGERIKLLDQLIFKMVKDTTKEWADCDQAINIIRNGDFNSVKTLCDESISYYKKLERDFLQHIEYTPKYYHRIVRFNRALRLMHLNGNSLTTIGHACNYYDQSHFIKDFHQFTGITPSRFRMENHIIADALIKNQVV
jgi:AraC-like DNA-binding protein